MDRGPLAVAFIGDAYVDLQTSTLQSLPLWGQDRTVDSIQVLPGGAACNSARHFASVCVSDIGACNYGTPSICCVIGDDTLGALMYSHLSSTTAQLDVNGVLQPKGIPQSVCMVLTGATDRAFISSNSSNEQLTAKHISEKQIFTGHDHVHIAGYFSCEGLQSDTFFHLVAQAKQQRPMLTISLDTQYDASHTWKGKDGCLLNLIALCDVFLPNEDEAKGIAGTTESVAAALDWLMAAAPQTLVVIKCGGDGVCAGLGGIKWTMKTRKLAAAELVDTNGAGDAFNCGFLYECIAGLHALRKSCAGTSWHHDPAFSDLVVRSLQSGCAAGTWCVQQHGACSNLMKVENLAPSQTTG